MPHQSHEFSVLTPAQSRAGRALLGITQADLAKAAGIDRTVVVRFEGELMTTRPASLESLVQAFRYLGVQFMENEDFLVVQLQKRSLDPNGTPS